MQNAFTRAKSDYARVNLVSLSLNPLKARKSLCLLQIGKGISICFVIYEVDEAHLSHPQLPFKRLSIETLLKNFV